MARITVEDCIDKFPSRFELVLVAANRARKLHSGETPTVDVDNDKNTVIALREIADQTLSVDNLKSNLIEEYQTATLSEDDEIHHDTDLNKNDEVETEDEINTFIEDANFKSEEENQLNLNKVNESDDQISEDTSPELSEDSE
tara:strand:+ start:424 stop:852 length:429 start_codon:yes stop_codon:yes gene_type:complete